MNIVTFKNEVFDLDSFIVVANRPRPEWGDFEKGDILIMLHKGGVQFPLQIHDCTVPEFCEFVNNHTKKANQEETSHDQK